MKTGYYARVSTDRQEREETINSQIEAMRKYARELNIEIDKQHEYVDQGYSGSILARPELDKLREAVKQKKLARLLVYSADRLSRNQAHMHFLWGEFEEYGVEVICVNNPELSNPSEESRIVSRSVNAMVAELERLRIRERTRRGKKFKAEQKGLIVGGIPPYGYVYIKRDKTQGIEGRYEINPAEAETVRLIFELFVAGRPIRAIARELTSRGLRPRQNRRWRTSTLHRIIRNETYVGVTHFNKNYLAEPRKRNPGMSETPYRKRKNTSHRLRPKEDWIPIRLPEPLWIISREMFELAQRQLTVNASQSPRNTKHDYLLRGLMACGNCGSPFGGEPCHGKFYYRCRNRNRTFPMPKACDMGSLKAALVDDLVWEKVCGVILQPQVVFDQIRKINEGDLAHAEKMKTDADQAERQLGGLQNQEDRLLEAYRSGVLDMGQLKDQMAKIRGDRERLTAIRDTLQTQVPVQYSPAEIKSRIREYCRMLMVGLKNLPQEGRRQVINCLVNKVIVDGKLLKIKGAIPLNPIPEGTSPSRIVSQLS